MKTRSKLLKRLTSLLLISAMLIAMLPTLISNAVTADSYLRETDEVTLNDWKNYFGTDVFDTVNAGRIWTDKSVFTDMGVLGNLVDADGDEVNLSVDARNFLVALSAIATNKSIVGYSHIPTDTILVLDISGSMGPGNGSTYNDAVEDMVTAANAAITSLQGLNKHNRVGVVLYSSNTNDDSPAILLPLGKYETDNVQTYDNGTPRDTSDDKTISVYLETNRNRNVVSIASDVYYYGTTDNVRVKTVDVSGGTYTQSGIDTAMDMFLAVDEDDTVISGSDFQNGTERKPVIVLMSDGDATYANSNYSNVPSSSNVGNGSNSSNENRFLTQLTAAQAKARISEHYNDSEVLFYTLGLGGMSAILDPSMATRDLTNLWESFIELDDDEYLTISNRAVRPSSYITSVDDMYYVTDAFEADTRADLYTTFEQIVNQIIIQSLYSPTEVSTTTDFDGFITFTDVLGKYMEVKEIEGILLGSTLFTGELLAKAIAGAEEHLGTIANPTDLGNDLVWAVIQRMGLDQLTDRFPTHADRVAEARSLLNLAYTHGQLSYNASTGKFNNFIGWYADEDGKYIGFWDPSHTDDMIPENAVYTNKCYGMLGEVKDGYRQSDMLYVTIQIHTNIETKEQTMVFRIPSSLIPVVSYNVTLEGDSIESATDIDVEITDAEPIRLLYEIGLRSDINTLNITQKVDDEYKNADGTYTFYTNAYDVTAYERAEDGISLSPGVNTNASFNPSKENERYYFATDTLIYEKVSGELVEYDESAAPSRYNGTLYRVFTHFEKVGNTWGVYTDEAEISRATLLLAERYDSGDYSGMWYVPAGTVHHSLEVRETDKAPGTSVNEIPYVVYPMVQANNLMQAVLGNNGKLTVTPDTGLSITKAIDETITDLSAEYSFTVSGGAAGASFNAALEDINGNVISGPVSFDPNGEYTFSLKAGETLYITDINAGNYTVAENVTSSDNYHVMNISVDGTEVSGENVSTVSGVAVSDKKITEVEFVNTLGTGTPQESYLSITKTVTHDFGNNYTVDATKTFPISIDLGEDYAGETVDVYSTNLSGATQKTADANGVITYDIVHGERIILSVRVGTLVSVTEDLGNDYPGFAAPAISYTNGTLTGEAAQTVAEDSVLVVNVINDYEADSVNPVNVTLNASKVIEGREWLDSDEFTFELQRYNPHDASYDVVGTLTATKNSKTLDFSSIIQGYSFDTIGEYHFRIIETVEDGEELGGMTYDLVGRYFNVIVSDNLGGKLIISDVQAISLTSVTLENGTYKIKADDIVNTYAPLGDDEVFITIDKSVVIKGAPAGVNGSFTLSGFNFGLYDRSGNELVVSDPFVTDANGNAVIKLMLSATNAGEEFYYTVKEVIPAGDTTYDYDTTEYKIKIEVVDNLDGTVSAVLSIYDEDEDDYIEAADGNTATVSFVNEYVISGTVSKTLNIQKTVNNLGTLTLTPEGFKFVLKDENGAEVEVFETDENGEAEINFSYGLADVGKTFTFTLEEANTELANVTYDDEVYTIVVKVVLTDENEVDIELEITTSENAPVTGDTMTFVNDYDEDIPQTGDGTLLIGAGILLLAIVGGAILLTKKRRLV